MRGVLPRRSRLTNGFELVQFSRVGENAAFGD